jgi:hypothetical protein
MIIKRSLFLFGAFFVITVNFNVHAEDLQTGTTPRYGRRALVIDIDARVLEEEQIIWESEPKKEITFPGNPVSIKLMGSNVVVAVQFTPFIHRNGQNVIVAHGQIWIDDPNKGMCYYTSIQTIPMEFGEPIYFFPLGSSQQLDASIEIILTVNPNRAAAVTETSANTNNEN